MSLFTTLIPTLTRTPAQNETGASNSVPSTKPTYTIKENADAFSLTVYLPGVAKGGLEVTAENGQIRITGQRAWKQPEGWTALHRESPEVTYELVLEHDDAIDADKISAELQDGVLVATLPKSEAAKPRKIAVN